MSRTSQRWLGLGLPAGHMSSWLTARTAAMTSIDPGTLRGLLIRLPLIAVRRSGHRVRVLQGPLRGARWLPQSGLHSYWLGTYEYAKQLAFYRVLLQGDIVYDIGAHVGFYSLLASRHIGPAGHVYAFEPLQRNLTYLRSHVSFNAADNVTIIPAAVADHNGRRGFSRGIYTESGHETGRLSQTAEQEVATVGLDEGIRSGMLRAPRVMKVDVEGAELDVLIGASDLLRFTRPIVFLATHSQDLHLACCDLLTRLDYLLTPLDPVPLRDARELLCHPSDDPDSWGAN